MKWRVLRGAGVAFLWAGCAATLSGSVAAPMPKVAVKAGQVAAKPKAAVRKPVARLGEYSMRWAQVTGDLPATWETNSIGMTVGESERGRRLLIHSPADKARFVWTAAPYASGVVLEAPLRLVARNGRADGWAVAGIGLYNNEQNFWHLALVEAPEGNGNGHFVELSEMRRGTWNAQGELKPPLKVLSESPAFAWQYGHEYSLRLTRAHENGQPILRGEVLKNGAVMWHRTVQLSPDSVPSGRPFLTSSFMRGDFGDVRANITKIAPAPAPLPTFKAPPYVPIVKPSTQPGVPKPQKGTGFFRTFQQNGKWWILDPKGTPMLSVGTDHVSYNAHWSEKLGFAPYNRNVEAKYGSPEKWAQNATRRLRDWNFVTVGAGNHPATRYKGLTHTEFISFGQEFSDIAPLVTKVHWTGFPDVFDPRWAKFCELKARAQIAPHKSDPWLLGYFLDNELQWYGTIGEDLGKYALALEAARRPATSAAKRAFVSLLKTHYKNDIAPMNADFGLNAGSWEALPGITNWKAPLSTRARLACDAFIEEAARLYFEVPVKAIRKYDPNHMILGSRFAGEAPDAAWKWSGKTCDIVTYNTYPRVNLFTGQSPDLDKSLAHAWNLTKKPVIITEWSFPALDAFDWMGRPLPSKHGAGMRVDNQKQKARAYTLFQKRIFQEPFIVGSHYFMWVDEPALGISSTFPEDSNYGLVNDRDEAYPELTAAAKNVNAQAMAIHAGAPFKGNLPPMDITAANTKTLPDATVTIAQENGGTTISNGMLQLKTLPNALEISLMRNGNPEPAGWFQSMQHQGVYGQNVWSGSDVVEDLQIISREEKKVVFEASFRGGVSQVAEIGQTGDAKPITASAQPWRARVRFTVEAGVPYFTASTQWVENTGQTPWELRSYFHYLPPRMGDGGKGALSNQREVPNYWMNAGVWMDNASKISYGGFWEREHPDFRAAFWRDEGGGAHPDMMRQVNTMLQPGARWTVPAGEPNSYVFATDDTAMARSYVSIVSHLRR